MQPPHLMRAGLTLKSRERVATLQIEPSSCLSLLTSVTWTERVQGKSRDKDREGTKKGQHFFICQGTVLPNSSSSEWLRERGRNLGLCQVQAKFKPLCSGGGYLLADGSR